MMRPRWHKALADLWSNKMRSLLVIVSIAIGLFAVGLISTTHAWLGLAMRDGYAAQNPANIIITAAGFPADFVDRIRNLPDVQEAEGVALVSLRVQTGQDTSTPIDIQAFPEMDEKQINQLTLLEGKYPPADREIVLDINKLEDTAARLGDTITVQLPSGRLREMKVVGIVRDMTIGAGGMGGGYFIAPPQGYITFETLAWLEQPELLNQLHATVRSGDADLEHIQSVAGTLMDEFERNSLITISRAAMTSTAHPNNPYLESMLGLLVMLGFLVVFLSAFIITNTLSALLNQQIQQVGVMKTIGASRFQIRSIYMVLILVYSLAALGLALAFSDRAAYALLTFLSTRINFNLPAVQPVPRSILLQALIALIVPQVAGSLPILQGTRITIQQALSGTGSGNADRPSVVYRWLAKIRGLSRPMLISLRNTFRRRLRLVLTLVTLILGGAIFIGVFNVRTTIDHYMDRLGKYFIADVNLTLSEPHSIREMTAILKQVPGVVSVEGWAGARAELVEPDGSVGEAVILQAVPTDSTLIEPILTAGRWILPGDENAIVLNEMFNESLPGIAIGDTVRLRVNGEETEWVVVGFFQFAGKSGGLLAYTGFDHLSRLTSMTGRSMFYRIVTAEGMHTLEQQEELGAVLEAHLNRQGIEVSEITAGLSLNETTARGLDTLTTFLLFMALLMAAVGSMGLMGTMSLNVMERTREIGVMRAIGATDRHITRLVLVEGMLIGLISWVLACLASFPIGKMLSDVVSIAIFSMPIDFVFTATGVFIWLGLVTILSILASVLPARSAARLTIREVLAYE